ncbi:MAG: YjbH domain-containing protein [Alphaproteobacteria bacterium]|nr:YjbH domain-containing protein [Alphaproteobacteria bacterium]
MSCRLRGGRVAWRLGAAVIVAMFCGWSHGVAEADGEPLRPEYVPSASDFGGVGLLQTRTARFGPDGQLDVGFSHVRPYDRYLITLQALPWLEGTFRYVSVRNRNFSGGSSQVDKSAFKDRGADLKFRLLNEGRYLPALAVGFQDGLGTGLFGGEYLVASKRYFDLDFSFGVGWGYSAGSSSLKNPLINLSPGFRNRSNAASEGGTLNLGQWFSGETIGLFGGVEYTTPLPGLSVKVEYDPNDYRSEPLNNSFEWTSHINYGVNYRPWSWIDLSFARERGTAYMFRASLRANLNEPGIPKFDPAPPKLRIRQPRASLAEADDAPTSDGVGWVGDRSDRSPQSAPSGLVDALATLQRFDIDVRAVSLDEDGVTIAIGDEPSPLVRRAVAEALSDSGLDQSGVQIVWPSGVEEMAASLAGRTSNETKDTTAGVSRAVPVETGASPTRVSATAIKATFVSSREVISPMIAELKEEGFTVDAVDITPPTATLVLAGRRYRQTARNLGRAMRVVHNHLPDSVEQFTIVALIAGFEVNRVTFRRKDIDAIAENRGSIEELWFGAKIEGPTHEPLSATAIRNPDRYPDFAYSLRPQLRQHIGSRDGFYLFEVVAALSGRVQLNRHTSIAGTVGKNLYDNLDRLTVEADSALPRVRSDIKEYLRQGKDNLIRLQVVNLWSPYPDFYARFTAGILEEMFGGYGGEVLYRPFGSRFAAGVDAAYAYQRDFDQRFGFRDYSVATGHVNLYYQTPFYDILTSAHIGQYLAGDRGATFAASRSFRNGTRVGAFFTLTDVPFAVFGEGSFDKGFFMAIPFDILSTRSTQNVGSFSFRPLTKDGGQRLGIAPRLYDVVGGVNTDGIMEHWEQLLD